MIESRINNRVVYIVDHEDQFILNTISSDIISVSDIDTPSSSFGTKLILNMSSGIDSPVEYEVISVVINVKRGAGPSIQLSSGFVQVDELLFTNISQVDTPGMLSISLTLSYKTNSSRVEYDYQQTYTTSMSLRRN